PARVKGESRRCYFQWRSANASAEPIMSNGKVSDRLPVKQDTAVMPLDEPSMKALPKRPYLSILSLDLLQSLAHSSHVSRYYSYRVSSLPANSAAPHTGILRSSKLRA